MNLWGKLPAGAVSGRPPKNKGLGFRVLEQWG